MAKASGYTLGGKPSKSDQNKEKHVYKNTENVNRGHSITALNQQGRDFQCIFTLVSHL